MSLVNLRVTLLVVIICVPLYFLLPIGGRWYTRRALVCKRGCKEPPTLAIDLDGIHQKAAKEHKFLEATTQLFREHGRIYKALRSGRTFIRTSDPEVSKAVLSTHFKCFGLQPLRYEGGKGFFGNGLLVTDGAQWKNSRALIRPAFDVSHIANFDRLSGYVERFMDLLTHDGSTIDLFPIFKYLVFFE